MTTETIERTTADVLDDLREARDAMSVKRVFGDPIELEDRTVIPVARVFGGAGGGGGESDEAEEAGSGFGAGFGLNVHPVGVYELRGGKLEWKPTVDVNRVIRGGQVLTAIVAICITLVLLRRQRAAC